jgi:hypothetical protein
VIGNDEDAVVVMRVPGGFDRFFAAWLKNKKRRARNAGSRAAA